MANFQPFKSYILFVMDEWIQKYNIQGPFLDAGCGIGDVSLHLAIKGWQGDAIDISTQSLKIAQTLLQPYPEISVEQKSIDFDPSKKFNFILLLDVLEHLPDDKSVLMAAARMGFTNAYTMITVPSNPDREWRWDDEVYGHLRRYKPNEIEDIICSSGFEVMEMWEISYPLFWFLRRLYTLILSQPTLSGNLLETFI
jgi:SAM-dependent methyltransferase